MAAADWWARRIAHGILTGLVLRALCYGGVESSVIMKRSSSREHEAESNMRLRSGLYGAFRVARVGALLALSLLTLVVAAMHFAPVAHAADSVSLTILVPKPSSNTAEGPVGTNLTVSGQGATAGHDYQLSFALTKLGCSAGGALGSATADSDGKFTTTLSWPDAASSVGATYVICYKDKSQVSIAQPSDQSFKVDAASPPFIALAQAPSATPDPNAPPGTYPAGGPVQITGKNYYSNHTTLFAFVTLNQDFAPSDLQSGSALQQVNDGAGFNADANGAFTVTVKLPAFTGNFFLHVVSNDGTGKYLPALIATKPITIGQAPTPTATVGPTITPSVSVTPTPTGGGSSGTGISAAALVGVLSLGGLSILLFILGVYLLTATGATPRNL
jgi:hypothetical protein